MKLYFGVFAVFLAFAVNVNGDPLDEDFGYVDVRPGAHMFWVVYHTELPGDWTKHPLILWLQGGPGASGVGFGNFMELGPYDTDGNIREGRWTKKANVMFVDSPVGTGYSYVDDHDELCTDLSQISDDLLTFLKSVFSDYPDMQKMPFFVYAESYGGKVTADFAIALDKAINNGEITCDFQGVALGDSWISPMDSVNTWGPFLYSMGFVNKDGQAAVDKAAARTQAAVDNGRWLEATSEFSNTKRVIMKETGGVDFYNVLVPDSSIYSTTARFSSPKKYSFMRPEILELYLRHVMPLSNEARESLTDFMNGPQAQQWNIPSNVVWDSQSGYVFNHLRKEHMKPVITSVAYLLKNTDLHVAVYTGDLDLICDTPGTYLWIDRMDYPQKNGFENAERETLNVPNYPNNAGYVQRFERFSLFTLLRSGHMVPVDVPDMALEMIDMITQYAAEASVSKAKYKKLKNKVSIVHSKLENSKMTQAEEPQKKEVKQVMNQKKEQEKQVVDQKKEQVKQVVEQKKEQVKQLVEQKKEQVEEQKKEVKQIVEQKKEVKQVVEQSKEQEKQVVDHKKDQVINQAKEQVKQLVKQKKDQVVEQKKEQIVRQKKEQVKQIEGQKKEQSKSVVGEKKEQVKQLVKQKKDQVVEQKKEQIVGQKKEQVKQIEGQKKEQSKSVVAEKKEQVKQTVEQKKKQGEEQKKEEEPKKGQIPNVIVKKEQSKPTNYEKVEIDENVSKMLKQKVFQNTQKIHAAKLQKISEEGGDKKPVESDKIR